jgi:hypothetical protein
MGLYFEAKLREAEMTINALINTIQREGGGVFISELDESGFCAKLTRPIKITYWTPVRQKENDDVYVACGYSAEGSNE